MTIQPAEEARIVPTHEGWWWVRTASAENLEGWRPVWVYSLGPHTRATALGFDEPARNGWVLARHYAWAGPCTLPDEKKERR